MDSLYIDSNGTFGLNLKHRIINNYICLCDLTSSYYTNIDGTFRNFVNNYIIKNNLKLFLKIANYDNCILTGNNFRIVNALTIYDYHNTIIQKITNLEILHYLYLFRCKNITNIQNLPLLRVLIINNCGNLINRLNGLSSIQILIIHNTSIINNLSYFINLQTVITNTLNIYGLHTLKKINKLYIDNEKVKNQIKKLNKYKDENYIVFDIKGSYINHDSYVYE